MIKLIVVIIPPVDNSANPLLQWYDNFSIQLLKNRFHFIYFIGHQILTEYITHCFPVLKIS